MRTYNYSSYDVRLLAIIMVIDSSGYLRIAGYVVDNKAVNKSSGY